VVVGAGLLVAWLLADPRTPDLAAQAYRVGLYERTGFGVFDERWYGGHGLPGYGLLFAPGASLVGMRLLATISVLVSILLFERLVVEVYGDGWLVRAGACVFAVAAVGDVWSGRLTFAFGVTFGVACVFALWRGHPWAGGALAGVCGAASPVAGLLLLLGVFTYALDRRSVRVLAMVGVPVVLVLGPLELLFSEGGFEPYPVRSFGATVVVMVAFLWAVPPREHLLRLGAVVYLIACVLALAIHTAMGSNIERYGVLLAGPLLLCALGRDRRDTHGRGVLDGGVDGGWAPRPWAGGPGGGGSAGGSPLKRGPARAHTRARGAVVLGVCLAAIGVWIVWGPVRETRAVASSAGTSASYYEPVEGFLEEHGGRLERVEVPLTRSHWEAAYLAPRVSLARGWEKQLEERYDGVLLGEGLTAQSYHRWLREQGVSYVALPDVALDGSSAGEGALIRDGLGYLKEVFSSEHWRVYEVRDGTGLLEGPGRLTALGSEAFGLVADRPGRFLVRIHHTRYFTVTAGNGCVRGAPEGWTYVQARAAGRIRVEARFSIGRALGLGGYCRG
jgi:hypothetical protein